MAKGGAFALVVLSNLGVSFLFFFVSLGTLKGEIFKMLEG